MWVVSDWDHEEYYGPFNTEQAAKDWIKSFSNTMRNLPEEHEWYDPHGYWEQDCAVIEVTDPPSDPNNLALKNLEQQIQRLEDQKQELSMRKNELGGVSLSGGLYNANP